ncbi:hypothetical protein AWL63_18210 [Sphingomonas panacis]|uniref:Uncharacterized protein n=1 Tax=Sphingomonas panacis TaxID=1560345 RepID=A0A1B3ZDR4_9SPHN|nr:hypothetical protein AWL63_18210 [Sphingomonas panacis]
MLSRARDALQNPEGITAPDLVVLLDELGNAADSATAGNSDWPLDIHVASIAHREGVNHHAACTRTALFREIAAYCREWWYELPDDQDPARIDDERVAQIYFEEHPEESLSTSELTLESTPSEVADRPSETSIPAADIASAETDISSRQQATATAIYKRYDFGRPVGDADAWWTTIPGDIFSRTIWFSCDHTGIPVPPATLCITFEPGTDHLVSAVATDSDGNSVGSLRPAGTR